MPVKRSNLSINTIMAYCEALLVIAKSCSLLPHYRPISISTLQSQNDCKYNQTYTNCRVQFYASVNHQIASISEAYNKLAVVDEKVARYCHTICTFLSYTTSKAGRSRRRRPESSACAYTYVRSAVAIDLPSFGVDR